MSLPAPVLQIDGLVVRAQGRVILDLPRLRLQAGEKLAVVGPNGAGKSTLLRCLSGFMRPDAGQVQVLGHGLAPQVPSGADLRALRAEVGQVLQGVHLVARLSALENVLVGALGRLQGADRWRSCLRIYPAAERDAALTALTAVGMGERAHQRVDRLSGGERQKVAMARMLMQKPSLILADEPTASLDPAASRQACELLASCTQGATQGAALVAIVHDPALVPLLAARVLGLRGGQCLFDLPLAQIGAAEWAQLYRDTAHADAHAPEAQAREAAERATWAAFGAAPPAMARSRSVN